MQQDWQAGREARQAEETDEEKRKRCSTARQGVGDVDVLSLMQRRHGGPDVSSGDCGAPRI